MSNYVKSTNFTAKDSLPTGDTNKVIRGSEFDTEFNAISTAIATKSDIESPTFTGTVTIPTADINGGNIDGTTVGGSTASAGSFTTLSASSTFTLGGVAITSTAAELNILDGVTSTAAELNILDGVTATTAELNTLDGVTATFGEINLLDGSIAGTIVNSKSVVYGASGEVNATTLQIGGVSITSTAAELNILDGVTATTAELNILDGVTATTAELNILDGVTSTASELNVLDGVTAFLDEDAMTSNSATALASQQSIKAYVDSQVGGSTTLSGLTDTNVTTPADGALLFYDTATSKWIDNVVSGDITIADTGVAAIGTGVIVNADISPSAAIDISKLNGVTSTAAELNILDGVTATTAELNYVDGVTSNIQTQLDSKAGTGKAIAMAIVFG
jgi:hypothetical protein